ncbi:MAG: hypothetical protein U0R26_08820 [Solirubrobacterales bacterium]
MPASQQGRLEDLKNGQSLFQTNCGTCRTLYAAGTDGSYGPNLDDAGSVGPPTGPSAKDTIKATEGRVLNAVENGVDSSTTLGRMPGGILNEAGQGSRGIRRRHGRRRLNPHRHRSDLA